MVNFVLVTLPFKYLLSQNWSKMRLSILASVIFSSLVCAQSIIPQYTPQLQTHHAKYDSRTADYPELPATFLFTTSPITVSRSASYLQVYISFL